jgi:hypothetical protein
MKSEQTSTRGYRSRYAGVDTFVTAAQYITEIICENLSIKNRQDLPLKFWKLPEWKKFYASQIHSANSLLRLYDERAIIRALKSNKGRYVYSLRAPHLDALIEAEQRKLAIELKPTEIAPQTDNVAPAKPFVGKGNVFKKLKGL